MSVGAHKWCPFPFQQHISNKAKLPTRSFSRGGWGLHVLLFCLQSWMRRTLRVCPVCSHGWGGLHALLSLPAVMVKAFHGVHEADSLTFITPNSWRSTQPQNQGLHFCSAEDWIKGLHMRSTSILELIPSSFTEYWKIQSSSAVCFREQCETLGRQRQGSREVEIGTGPFWVLGGGCPYVCFLLKGSLH